MKDYVDLVLTDKRTVLEAPYCSGLKTGDTVIIEIEASTFLHEVRRVISCSIDSEEYAFIKGIIGLYPSKIKSKAVKFDYGEGNSDV